MGQLDLANPKAPAKKSGNAIFARFAAKYGVDVNKVSDILKNTAFKVKDTGVSDEQMVALLVVADQYNLNPFIKEIYAFPDSNGRGITPIVPIDGWTRIANEHPEYDGVEFNYAETTYKVGNKECPEWIEAVIYRKDRTNPTKVKEYMDECHKNGGAWGSHPRRMLRHKAFMQCCRVALSFGGIYDEDEAMRIAEARLIEAPSTQPAIDITPEPQALPIGEAFTNLMAECGYGEQPELVSKYMGVCVEQLKKSIEEVQAEAINRPDQFIKAFEGWANSIKGDKKGNTDTAQTSSEPESKEIECALHGTTVRTGVECVKCPDRDGKCPYWNSN